MGGTADPSWNGELAQSIAGIEVLEIHNADHSLQIEGDPDESLDALRTVADAIRRSLENLK